MPATPSWPATPALIQYRTSRLRHALVPRIAGEKPVAGMRGTQVLFGQIGVVFGIVIAGVWSATQWTAAALGYPIGMSIGRSRQQKMCASDSKSDGKSLCQSQPSPLTVRVSGPVDDGGGVSGLFADYRQLS